MTENMSTIEQLTLQRIVDEMRRARRLLFITGAGISADSGLPTYRGIGGLYEANLTAEDIPIELALSGQVMNAAPAITWKYIHQIEQSCRDAHFNEAHAIIAKLQDEFDKVCVLTQNVDGFHRAAGSRNLIEIHGDIHDLYCTACNYQTMVADYSGLDMPPLCPHCNAVVRPKVVLFGEVLPTEAVEKLYEQLSQGFDMVFSVGTTSTFPYIAEPIYEARSLGVPTVEINPGETEISPVVDYKVAAGAADTLREIWRLYRNTAPQ